LAPDALSPLGGYPEMMMTAGSYKENVAVKKCSKTSLAYDYLKSHKEIVMDILWWALFWRLDQYDGSQNSQNCAQQFSITEDNPLQKNEQIKTPIMQYAGFRWSK
jgi:ATP-dependent Zn protease